MGNYINWTEEEFKAYLCIYAAESNFEYHIDEKKLIESEEGKELKVLILKFKTGKI